MDALANIIRAKKSTDRLLMRFNKMLDEVDKKRAEEIKNSRKKFRNWGLAGLGILTVGGIGTIVQKSELIDELTVLSGKAYNYLANLGGYDPSATHTVFYEQPYVIPALAILGIVGFTSLSQANAYRKDIKALERELED